MSLKLMVLITSVLVAVDATKFGLTFMVLSGSHIKLEIRNTTVAVYNTRNQTVELERLRQFIVTKHNELRATVTPPAINMRNMKWDTELEKFAKEGAKCRYLLKHRQNRMGHGENVFLLQSNRSLDDMIFNLNNGLNHWWGENRYYNFADGSCSARTCGHYTQMAWAMTTLVGCAWKMNCPLSSPGIVYKYSFLLVCNYEFVGNHRILSAKTGTYFLVPPYITKETSYTRSSTRPTRRTTVRQTTTTQTTTLASTLSTKPQTTTKTTPTTPLTIRKGTTTKTTTTQKTTLATTPSKIVETTTKMTPPTPTTTRRVRPRPATSTRTTSRLITANKPSPMDRAWVTPFPVHISTEADLISCITFDHGWDHLQNLKGLWVKNNGVRIISGGCIHKNCGYFSNGATIEIPFFKNRLAYDSFSVSFFFRSKTGNNGFMWNGCPATFGSSLSIGGYNNALKIRMNDKDFAVSTSPLIDTDHWHHFVLSWDGLLATVYIDKVQTNQFYFQGELQRRICPLVIGRAAHQSFSGIMDEICLYRGSLSKAAVDNIYNRQLGARNIGNIGKFGFQSLWTAFKTVSDPAKVLTCVTFEKGWDHVQGTRGVYVKNDGVKVVSGDCRRLSCGYFDGQSFLSVPFFKGNLPQKGFSLSFFFKGDMSGSSTTSAMISNQCVRQNYITRTIVVTGRSSVLVSMTNGRVDTTLMNGQTEFIGVKASELKCPSSVRQMELAERELLPRGGIVIALQASYNDWHHYALTWDGQEVSVYIDSVLIENRPPLSGHLNNAKCSMNIGIGTVNREPSFFHGRMDEVCFLRGVLSGEDVRKINNDPSYITQL